MRNDIPALVIYGQIYSTVKYGGITYVLISTSLLKCSWSL